MKIKKLFAALIFFLFVFAPQSFANNLSVSNAALTSPNATEGTTQVQFDISWSNSWRNSVNYDAAWVFIKYSTDSGTSWSHATLKKYGTTPTGFNTGSGTAIEIVVPSDKKGAFIERSGSGAGPLSTTSVQLVWDYSGDGVSNSASVRVKVVGIEMVYIPTGSFYIGDGDGFTEAVRALHVTDNTAVQVTSSQLAGVTVDLNNDDNIDTTPVTIHPSNATGITGNSSYLTGYYAFYLMKYEITEGQWVDFFNTLASAQKTTRDITSATGKNSDSTVTRNTIAWTSGDATTTRSDRGCSYLSWMDGAAFTDWAALRPITELEYEKACRGSSSAVLAEYAWGSTTINITRTISGTENGTETISTSGANISVDYVTYVGGDTSSGPLRAGIFATSSSIRVQAGAGYYGNLDLAGNVAEKCISIGSSAGRLFTGSHGDGVLTTTSSYEGNATNTDWSGIDGTSARGVTGATGSGSRGGYWTDPILGYAREQTSDRITGAAVDTTRTNTGGFRAGRTAP